MRKTRLLALVMAMGLLLTACHQASGGGFIQGVGGEGTKATFGFDYQCEIDGFEIEGITGHFTYHDASVDMGTGYPVKIAGNVYLGCDSFSNEVSAFQGYYRPQPKKAGDGGIFKVWVTDDGTPGREGDTLTVWLIGGIFSGYYNSGPLLGGNITMEEH